MHRLFEYMDRERRRKVVGVEVALMLMMREMVMDSGLGGGGKLGSMRVVERMEAETEYQFIIQTK